MAEAETAHDMKKQTYLREAMEKVHITEAEARGRIQQAQHQAQQEAQQYAGNIASYAEEQHRTKMRAQTEQAKKEVQEANEQANKEAQEAKEQAKKEAE